MRRRHQSKRSLTFPVTFQHFTFPVTFRRRLNLKLLACLVAVLVVVGTSVHFLHAYQVKRNAGALLAQANRAEQEGDLAAAYNYLNQYRRFVPDDTDAYVRYAVLADKLRGNPDSSPASLRACMHNLSLLGQAVQRKPERNDIRRRLVELAMELGRYDPRFFSEASDQLKVLVEAAPNDGELEYLLGECLEFANQFADAGSWYEKAIEHAPRQVKSYERLARLKRRQLANPLQDLILQQKGEPLPADALMDNLIKACDGSVESQLAKVRYHQEFGELERAAEQVEQVRRTAPDNPEVLLRAAEVAAARGVEELGKGADKEEAQKYFSQASKDLELCLKVDGSNAAALEAMARLDLLMRRNAAAINHLKQAIALAKDQRQGLWAMANLLIDTNDLDDARQAIANLRQARTPAELVYYLEARILVKEEKWSAAVAILKRIRPTLGREGDLPKQADVLLGRCYGQLANPDLQLEAYRKALAIDPSWAPARAGEASALLALGRNDEALQAFRQLASRAPAVRLDVARLRLLQNLNLPAAERQWEEINDLLKADAWPKPEPVPVTVLRAQALAAQGQVAEAKASLKAVSDQRPKETMVWIALADLLNGQKEPDEALAVLEEAAKRLNDPVELRLARASIWAGRSGAEARPALAQLERDRGTLSEAHQTRLLEGLAVIYQRIGDTKEAGRLWGEAARRQPQDMRARVEVLNQALKAGDDAAARKVLEEIKTIEGPSGPVGLYGEAHLLVKQEDRKQLGEARRYLAEAGKQRPSWPPIPLLLAQIDAIEGDIDGAIKNYQQAINLGESAPEAIRRAVQMLYARRRFEEAQELLQKLQKQAPLARDLSRIDAEVAMSQQDMARALERARQAVPEDAKDWRDLVWLGQLESAAGDPVSADKTLRRAVALDPRVIDTHMALVLHRVRTNQKDAAGAAAQEAVRSLSADQGNLVQAVYLDTTGRRDQAETPYLDAVKAKPNDPTILGAVAGYYLRAGQFPRAERYLRELLADRVQASNAAKAEARRRLALGLASRGREHFAEALALIEQNLPAGSNPEDRAVQAAVLATHPDRRREAINLLEKLNADRQLATDGRFLLARLYETERDWPRAKDLMLGVLSAPGGNKPQLLAHCISSLLRNDEANLASVWLGQLEEIEPHAYRTVELKARVLSRTGNKTGAVEVVRKYAREQKADNLARAAALMEELDPAAARELYDRCVAQSREPGSVLLLASYLARQGKIRDALEHWEHVRELLTPESAAVAGVAVLGQAKSRGAEDCRRVEQWIEMVMSKHPDKVPALRLPLASLRYHQGEYDKAEGLYRLVLEKDARNVMALNNLAWLLALKNDSKTAEALNLIQAAVDAVGPAADLLGTRGVIHLMLGRRGDAVKDLEIAVREAPTPTRHMYLAKAYLTAGDRRAAEDEWKRAKEAGLALAHMAPLERPVFQQLVTDLDRR